MKKVMILAATTLATALTAGSVFAQGGVELNSAQMDNVSAGWGQPVIRHIPNRAFNYDNKASASGVAFAKGQRTRTNTQTYAETGNGFSASGSNSHASSKGGFRAYHGYGW